MKTIVYIFLFIITLYSCNNGKIEYHKNLNTFKNLIIDINNYFIDSNSTNIEISNYYTEDFKFYSYPAGHKKGVTTSKKDYINEFNEMKKMNMSINIDHSIYLPGMDQDSHKLDGSVRVYYGATIYFDENNTEFSGYQTINFEDGKISGIWEWADYGGVNNQLNEFVK